MISGVNGRKGPLEAAAGGAKADPEDETGLFNMAPHGQTGERDLQVWRRKLDDLKAKTKKKGEHLESVNDRLKEI